MSQDSYYSKGGGGYLPQSPYTPGGGASQKSELSASLRPITICQLNKATQQHSDAEWRLEEIELGQVTVVAQVTQVQQQATNCVYQLDDGSGRIEARQWMNAEADGSIQEGIKEHVYVRVTGGIKAFNQKRYVNATHIRPAHYHEFCFHSIEAMTVTLAMDRGMPNAPGGASKTKDVVMGDASAYSAQPGAGGGVERFPHLPPLQRQIMRFLQDNCVSDEGVHVSAIARAVGSGNDAVKISDALDKLMDAGHVYTTLDESHFTIAG